MTLRWMTDIKAARSLIIRLFEARLKKMGPSPPSPGDRKGGGRLTKLNLIRWADMKATGGEWKRMKGERLHPPVCVFGGCRKRQLPPNRRQESRPPKPFAAIASQSLGVAFPQLNLILRQCASWVEIWNVRGGGQECR